MMKKNKKLPNNFFNLIASHSPDMLWAKDIDGKYLFANQEICDNLLMTKNPAEVVGKTDIFFALRERAKHPQNSQWHTFGELCHNSDEVVLQEMKKMRFEEYGNIRGKLVYFEVDKAPFYNEEGKLIGVIGNGRDITEQKELETQLDKSNKEAIHSFETLLNTTLEAIFIFDENKKVIQTNSVASSLFGYTNKEIIGMQIMDFIAKEDYTAVQNMLTKEHPKPYELRVVRKDGTLFHALIQGQDVILNSKKVRVSGVIDITELKNKESEVLRLAHYDQLTGLPNRNKLQSDMSNKKTYACAIFNIGSFREINDFFGVKAGDSILIQLANAMKSIFTNVYRIGGDDFALLFNYPLSRATIKEHIRSNLAKLHDISFVLSEETIKLNINVGIAINTDKLLTHADIALHQAKKKKAPFVVYEKDDKIEEIYKKNIAMTKAVHKALIEDRIICYYQPIVSLDTNEIMKYETLVRMIDEDGNIISPIDFLPIAKRTKLYPRITKTVIHQACKYFSDKDKEFSVNLSIDDINDPLAIQEIIKTIIDTNTANRIVFEILETEGIENYDSVIRFITQVKALGAKIAIDDFGSGYSNFEHILKLDIDFIKIDGSLIKAIASNRRHYIIVQTIIEFTKKIGAKTIAEFVCDEVVYNVVKSLGVDYSQGYYTGKPQLLPAELNF